MTIENSVVGVYAVSINPASGVEVARYEFLPAGALEQRLSTTYTAYRIWSQMPSGERLRVIGRMGAILRERVEELAMMATNEMGKPIAQARAEVLKCATLCDWCTENGEAILADEKTPIGENAYVSYLPIGPVLAVMPWNFPYWQAMRGACGILLGGNTYLLKHAPNVMGCAFLLEQCWLAAGLPAGAFSVLNITPDQVSQVIPDRRVAAVLVTGSVRAGSAIAAQAGAAVKKVVLELGGSDPFIVLCDANLDDAVRAAIEGRFQNTGQICIAAKRIILERPIADAFTESFLAGVRALVVGDPKQESTYIGPMARFDLRDELDGQVSRSVQEGARLLCGGSKLPLTGNYYAPTVLGGVQPHMAAFQEETFGPVASLIVAENADHAVELANQSDFGLSAAIWTGNGAYAQKLARQLETGGVFINGIPASDPRVPIGGVKKSGFGRELSYFGVREFMNAQTVWRDRR